MFLCSMKRMICFALIPVVFLCACRKPQKFSDIPEIKLLSFSRHQVPNNEKGAILIFSFQDGEGDIGLNGNDTLPPFDGMSPFYYNFFCDYYEKQKGVFTKIDSIEILGKMTLFNLNARIPRLTYLPEESIHGEITLTMPQYYVDTSPYKDTIKLSFYIVDRKLNRSNTEEVIVVSG